MIYSLLLLLTLCSRAWSFDKDFKTVNERVPLEFNLLFESMKLEVKTPLEKVQLVGICKDIDTNLGFLPKEHIFMLMKSGVIKDVLEYKFSKVRQFDISTTLLERLEVEFKKKERLLNPFAQWIWRSILAELKARKEMGFITARSFNARAFEGAKLSEALRFERYLTYLLPWIDKMDSSSAADFNQLTKTVSWVVLRRINERSLLFKRFSSTAAGDTKITLFNIPQKLLELNPQDLKNIRSEEPRATTLEEESQKEKTRTREDVDKVTPEDLSPISDGISKELDQKI